MSSGHMCRFLRAQQEGADKYKDHESVPSAGASEQNVSQSGGGEVGCQTYTCLTSD